MAHKSRCSTPLCRKAPRDGRKLCDCCRKRKQRENDPVAYQYDRLRASAAKRSLPFTLDKAWFREVCEQTDYHNRAGLMPGDLSIDRVDPLKGYEPGNVRVVERTVNTAKGNIERIHNIHIRRALLNRLNTPVAPYTPPEADENGVWW